MTRKTIDIAAYVYVLLVPGASLVPSKCDIGGNEEEI